MVVGSDNWGSLVGKLANNTTNWFAFKSSYVWGIDVLCIGPAFLNLNYCIPRLDDLSNWFSRITSNRVQEK